MLAVAPGKDRAVGGEGEAVGDPSRHSDDAPASKGLDLLRQQPVDLLVAVSAGGTHSLAITTDGAVFAWGKGEDGCLGHGEDLSNQLLPKKVEACAPEQG